MAYLCGSSCSWQNRPLHFCFDRFQAPLARHDLCKRVGASPWPHSPPKLIIFPVKSRTKFFLKFQNILAPQSHGGTMCVMR